MRLAPIVLGFVGLWIALGGAALWVLSEGALFTAGHHEWTVAIEPDGGGAWSLVLPAIVDLDGGEKADAALERLRASLRVLSGDGVATLEGPELRVSGGGAMEVHARTTFPGRASVSTKEAFFHWGAGETVAIRPDADGPTVRVRWAVDFRGTGHSCHGTGAHEATLGPGDRRPLVPAGPHPGGMLDEAICA